MSKSFRKDLTGQRFGRLVVLGFVSDESRYTKWKCQCDCGNKTVVNGQSLRSGLTKSCGCLNIAQAKKNFIKHGGAGTRLYQTWKNMKSRCYNRHNKRYKDYGGRGIIVCDEWRDNFQAFYDWAMVSGYDDTLTIERVDYDGNYEPLNCQWIKAEMQARNKRNNAMIFYQGVEMCLAEAAERSGIEWKTLRCRYYRGDRGKRLFRPIKK